jgi:nitrous oxidase accessory protein NosD
VNPGGTGGCFATIQAAVDAANPGDTISVAPGTYPELVTVNKPVTLRGAQANVDPRPGTRTGLPATESVVTGTSGSTSFHITADGVTIDGFTIQDNTSLSQFGAGIVMAPGTSGSRVLNNIIQNNMAAILVSNSSPTVQTVIQRNLLNNNNQPGAPWSGDAIYTDQLFSEGTAITNVLIDNNKFTNNHDAGLEIGATIPNVQSHVTISNNEFAANARGMVMIYTDSSSITGNYIHDSDSTTSADIRIYDGNTNLTITCNTLLNGAGRGIRVSRVLGDDLSSNITANFNNISGYASQAGLEVDVATYSGIFDAENNWWGNASGPTIASNPSGTGEDIVDPDGVVDYAPFLTSSATCSTLATSPANKQGWLEQITSANGLVQLITGPPVPPTGNGSLRLFTGTHGDESAAFRHSGFNGTALSSLSFMGYCTNVTQWNGAQTPYITLNVDRDNNGTVDDLLFFEPAYSNGVYNPSIPAQPNPTLNTWQCWKALRGGWYGLDANTLAPSFGGPGAGVLPFSNYVTAYPAAVIRNSAFGALRLVSGFASSGDVFDSSSDAFKVGIGPNLTIYDFEPGP